MKKYRTEFKLEVVQGFLNGEGGAKLFSRRWSVPEKWKLYKRTQEIYRRYLGASFPAIPESQSLLGITCAID